MNGKTEVCPGAVTRRRRCYIAQGNPGPLSARFAIVRSSRRERVAKDQLESTVTRDSLRTARRRGRCHGRLVEAAAQCQVQIGSLRQLLGLNTQARGARRVDGKLALLDRAQVDRTH